ncbi:hypothetical protein J6590_008515 [Homalodisca vitripennis]|nr:hypothetical protein J6590_008515 [Homalodisca vitripennis]
MQARDTNRIEIPKRMFQRTKRDIANYQCVSPSHLGLALPEVPAITSRPELYPGVDEYILVGRGRHLFKQLISK